MDRDPRTDGEDGWGALMAAAQQGDRESYARLLREIAPFLRRIVARHLERSGDAEDVVQETLIALHAVRHTYEPGRPFKPWLATLAGRRVIDQLRKRTRRGRHEVTAADEIVQSITDGESPATLAVRADDVRDVRAAVAGLPPRQREAVELLRLRELSLEEAARESGQTTGSLKVALHRALKSLRTMLDGTR